MKNISLLFAFFIYLPGPCIGQDINSEMLNDSLFYKARVLFNDQKYLDALSTYQQLIQQESRSSTSQLQLAKYIHESGRCWYESSQIDSASNYFQQAFVIRQAILPANDSLFESYYYNIANCFARKKQYSEAERNYISAINIGLLRDGNGNLETAMAFNNLGVVYSKIKKNDLEIQNHHEALKIRRRLLPMNHPMILFSLHNLGQAYERGNNFTAAYPLFVEGIDAYKALGKFNAQTLSFYRRLYDVLGGMGKTDQMVNLGFSKYRYFNLAAERDSSCLGKIYADLSECYTHIWKIDSAFYYSYECEKEYIKSAGNTAFDMGNLYYLRGILFSETNDWEKAIDFFLRAETIFVKLYGTETLYRGFIYNEMANVYKSKGDTEKAIEYAYKSIDIKTKNYGKDNVYLATSNMNLGIIFITKGNFAEAISNYRNALRLEVIHQGKSSQRAAQIYQNISLAFLKLKEPDSALVYMNLAEEIYSKKYNPDHINMVRNQIFKAEIMALRGKYEEAIQMYKSTINPIKSTLGFYNEQIAQVYTNVAILEGKMNRVKIAQSLIDSSLLTFHYGQKKDQIYSFIQILPFFNEKIKIYEKHPELFSCDYSASDLLKECFTFFNKFRAESISNRDELILKNSWIAYSSVLRQAFRLKSFEKSYDLCEISKSTILLRAIQETKSYRFADIPDSILVDETSFKQLITFLEKQRQSLLDQNLSETDTSVLSISSKIFDLRRRYESLKDTLETRYPEYYRLKYDLSTVSLDYVQDTLLQKGQTLLEYFTGDSAVYLFVIRPDTFQVVEVKKDFPLEDWVKHLRHGLTDAFKQNTPSPTYQESTAREYVSSAYDLYQKLITPVENLLTDTIIVVPDGVLGYVPFDVLLSEKPVNPTRFHSHSYLGKERHISYSYSATLLKEMREKKHRVQPTESLLALAPFFRGSADQLREQVDTMSELLALRRDTLSALPATGREALIVSKIFGGKALLGAESPKEILQQEAGRYRILHLSTHGKADDKVGDYAYLGFALPGNLLAFDKFYAKDIYNLSLNADLVTLSACETGIGELKRGEGIISLARAFAYAGAKSIVTTLWSVNDVRTSELMENFYKGLYNGMDKDAALWQAKKDFLKNHKGMAAHPYYWAGFIPIGDMSAIRN